MDRLVAVNNETLYIDRSCLRCFFHRIKWNCLDAFNASATLRGTPLWYPLSQFPATRLCLIPPPFFYRLFLAPRSLFFPPSTFAFLFSLHLSFFLSSPFSSPLFLSGARTLGKKKKTVRHEKTSGRGTWIRFNARNPIPFPYFAAGGAHRPRRKTFPLY